MNRSLVRWGFILFLLSLLTGFAIPALKRPQLGVSAHLIGAIGALVLVAVGLVWNSLALGDGAKRVLYWLWIVAIVGNWMQTLTASIVGGTHFMPIASGGPPTASTAETVLSAVIVIVSLDAVVATAMVIWGLRSRRLNGTD